MKSVLRESYLYFIPQATQVDTRVFVERHHVAIEAWASNGTVVLTDSRRLSDTFTVVGVWNLSMTFVITFPWDDSCTSSETALVDCGNSLRGTFASRLEETGALETIFQEVYYNQSHGAVSSAIMALMSSLQLDRQSLVVGAVEVLATVPTPTNTPTTAPHTNIIEINMYFLIVGSLVCVVCSVSVVLYCCSKTHPNKKKINVLVFTDIELL